jgi:hypothetical protein
MARTSLALATDDDGFKEDVDIFQDEDVLVVAK